MGYYRYTIVDEDNEVIAIDMSFDTATLLLRALFDLYYDMPRKYTMIKEDTSVKENVEPPMDSQG